MKFTFAPESSPLEGYTIKRAIHRGGFGEVYYALSSSGKEVALKLLNNNLEVELRGIRQCLNLKHPNLVTIFDIRQDQDGDYWIVMEYIGGRGLYEVLQGYPDGMPIPEVLKWLSGITAGLSFLHDRGIVHRDLKPANVFSDQDIVKIGDVGLSKYISESRRSAQTQSVGTVYYMAPEVAKGRYGREVDVYAIGIMLVEMLTGRVPFDGETTAEILMKHMTAEPDLSRISEEVRPVLVAALEKDPQQRIQDVEELERRFRSVVNAVAPSGPSRTKPRGQPAAPAAERRSPVVSPATATGLMASAFKTWSQLPAPAKWVIGGIAAFLLLETRILRPVATGALLGGFVSMYFGYKLLSLMFGSQRQTKSARQKTPPESRTGFRPELPTAVHRRQPMSGPAKALTSALLSPATPRRIVFAQRLRDLTNSLSVVPVAVVLVTLAITLTTNMLPGTPEAVFFAAVTILASWGLIVSGKLREGRVGDVFIRRLFQGGIGLSVGLTAAGLSHYLMLSDEDFLNSPDAAAKPWVMGKLTVSDGSGFPTTAAFMLFFGVLFALRRWWWQSDSFRRSRFRVSTALFTLFLGAIIGGLLPGFPDALGATWALAISAVVQLSAGWTPHEDRLPTPGSNVRKPKSVECQTTLHVGEREPVVQA